MLYDIFCIRYMHGFNTNKMLNGQMVVLIECQLGSSRLFSH